MSGTNNIDLVEGSGPDWIRSLSDEEPDVPERDSALGAYEFFEAGAAVGSFEAVVRGEFDHLASKHPDTWGRAIGFIKQHHSRSFFARTQPDPRVELAEPAVEVFHLQGQHDQSTHGNRGGAARSDDPTIRSDGVAFEFESVSDLADQFDGTHRQSASMKFEGAKRTASYLSEDEHAEIEAELQALTHGDARDAMMLDDTALAASSLGITGPDVPVGTLMQAATLSKAIANGTVESSYARTEPLAQKVDAFNAGEITADELSQFITDEWGVSVAAGAVDYRNSMWQQSSVFPPMVAFHLAAAEGRPGVSTGPLRAYYGSGSMQQAETVRSMIPDTIRAVNSASAFAVSDAIEMGVRRDARGTVTVYRGVKDTGHSYIDSLRGAESWQGNPLTSWTTDRETAAEFGGRYSTKGGYVITAEVPVSQIAGMSTVNGWGSVREREVVLYGDSTPITSIAETGGIDLDLEWI